MGGVRLPSRADAGRGLSELSRGGIGHERVGEDVEKEIARVALGVGHGVGTDAQGKVAVATVNGIVRKIEGNR